MTDWILCHTGRYRGRGRSRGRLARQCGNGLRDDAWPTTLFVDGRIVMALLVELRRPGFPHPAPGSGPAGRSADVLTERKIPQVPADFSTVVSVIGGRRLLGYAARHVASPSCCRIEHCQSAAERGPPLLARSADRSAAASAGLVTPAARDPVDTYFTGREAGLMIGNGDGGGARR